MGSFFVVFILCVTREWVHPVPCRTRQLSTPSPVGTAEGIRGMAREPKGRFCLLCESASLSTMAREPNQCFSDLCEVG